MKNTNVRCEHAAHMSATRSHLDPVILAAHPLMKINRHLGCRLDEGLMKRICVRSNKAPRTARSILFINKQNKNTPHHIGFYFPAAFLPFLSLSLALAFATRCSISSSLGCGWLADQQGKKQSVSMNTHTQHKTATMHSTGRPRTLK
jgi:hypothetical protein